MAAQIFIFFAAGFRPVSFLIAMAIMELAMHRQFQVKLRNELESYLQDQPISSEIISKSELPFLDKVIKGIPRLKYCVIVK